MATQIITRAAQARCYACGSAAITMVCHHCGQGLCNAHAPRRSDLQRWLWRGDFSGLGLPDDAAQPVYCGDCVQTPQAPSTLVLAIGPLVALIGVLLLIQRFSPAALWLVLLGGVLALAAYGLQRRWRAASARTLPPLPLLPRFNSVKVRETIAARITLDSAGTYRAELQPATGEIEIASSLAHDERARLQLYRARYRLAAERPVRYCAGFAVLRGKAAIQLAGPGSADLAAPNILALSGQSGELPFLHSEAGHGLDTFVRTYPYRVLDSAEPLALPISLVPSFIPEAGQRALDLELQWSELIQWGAALPIERIKLLRIDVPIAWGAVESVVGGHAIIAQHAADRDTILQRIEWSQLPIAADRMPQQCRRFSIRFDGQIDHADRICGRMEVIFKGALSAIEGAEIYSSLGRRRSGYASQVRTTVAVDFELSLAGVRYQEVRVVPDLRHPLDPPEREVAVYAGVIPNYATVSALTDALSRRDYYVKRTVESPPRVGDHASRRNRYWDIAGRRYDGVYPIDFHIVLSGDELAGDRYGSGGSTHVSLTVQGTYANHAMEQQIEVVWDELRALIDATLHKRAAPGAQAAADRPETLAADWPAEHMDMADQAHERLAGLLDVLGTGEIALPELAHELVLLAHEIDQYAGAGQPLRQAEVGG